MLFNFNIVKIIINIFAKRKKIPHVLYSKITNSSEKSHKKYIDLKILTLCRYSVQAMLHCKEINKVIF